ncbi:MAG: DUF2889 domain-containing protein [Acidobacteria bacterium]|nr:DUF2889 domain-containing protein [Acidobacteriota bacterium]
MAKVYERNINIRVTDDGGDRVLLEATLLDLEHSIRIEMLVNVDSCGIEDAKAQMMKGPYTICPQALEQMRNLVGLKIGRGILHGVTKAVGGSAGCSHLVEVCQAAVQFGANFLLGRKADFKGLGYEDHKQWPEPAQIRLWLPVLRNTCHVFRESAVSDQPSAVSDGSAPELTV